MSNTNIVAFQPAVEADKRARKTAWQREQRRQFKAHHGYSTTAHYGAGTNRGAVLERDGHACVKCGMTDEQHKARWDRPITVDHISKDRSDNRMSNLQTLCLTCHGRKDLIAKLRVRKRDQYADQIRAGRAAGLTYQQIAEQTGLSIGSVWKVMNGAGK